MRVGHNHGQGVAGWHEELGTANHVAIRIAVGRGTEAWNGLPGVHLVALLHRKERNLPFHLFELMDGWEWWWSYLYRTLFRKLWQVCFLVIFAQTTHAHLLEPHSKGLVQTHVFHQLNSIGQIGICMSMPSRIRSAKVRLWSGIFGSSHWSTQLFFKET